MKSKRPLCSIVIVALMLVASFSAFASILPSFPVNSPQKAQISSYAPHAPIFFSDNAGFLGSNSSTGVSWGSGTVDDPYIIEGWGIDTASGGGISISYTDVHFIIRDCYVHDVAPTRSGIYLHSSANGILINNNCSSNQNGIYLDSSSNNTLINNTCSNNKRGISIHESSNNTLINNTCWNNYDGIYIYESSNNTVWNNTCNYNKLTGIHLGVSSNNTINWNNCSRNWDDGIGMWGCYGNVVYQNVVISNIDYGIDIPQGSRNRIWNNTFIGNNGATDTYNASHVQAYDNGNNNWWNSTNGYGNYWSDWTKPDNNAPYGRVDSPYNIDDGYRLDSKDGYDGHSKAKDYYPLTAPRISDPPYIPAPSDMLIPILAIAVVIIVAVILVSFIVLRKRKGETAEPPSVNQ